MQTITSDQNPRLKKALRLHESRGRKQQNRIVVFGCNEIRRAVDCKIDIVEYYCCPEIFSNEASELFDLIGPAEKVDILKLTPELFAKIGYGSRSDGLVAVAMRPATSAANIKTNPDSLVVVLESIEKPGNIGAAYRSADAAGVDGIFLADPVCDLFHPNAIRSSLGTVFSIPSVTDSSATVLEFLISNGFVIAAAKVNGDEIHFNVDLTGKVAVVLGNESRGLSRAWHGPEITDVTIPMVGISDSLNISVAASVILFEAQRQRLAKTAGK